jgi:muramidase (phage lysozyme)
MTTRLASRLLALALLVTPVAGCASEAPPEEEAAAAEDALSGGVPGNATCSPARAVGAVGTQPKALLDTIAWSEGTRGRGSDGYNVIVGYHYANDCTRHPNRLIRLSSSLSSTAAGRYQFLYGTWSSLGYPTFQPENQDRAGLKLVTRRGVSVPEGRPLSATEFSNALSRLSYEWASLPPNRYGQGVHTASAVRAEYCKNAGCAR